MCQSSPLWLDLRDPCKPPGKWDAVGVKPGMEPNSWGLCWVLAASNHMPSPSPHSCFVGRSGCYLVSEHQGIWIVPRCLLGRVVLIISSQKAFSQCLRNLQGGGRAVAPAHAWPFLQFSNPQSYGVPFCFTSTKQMY